MSFRRYPDYVDSGAGWLGEVPKHWNVRRLGYFFRERREKVSDTEFAPLSVTKKGIVPQLETAAKTDDNDNRKKVTAGDFVINSRSDRKGSAGLSPLDGSVSLINTVLVPGSEVCGRFVHHLLRSELFQEEFYRFGKGIVADLWSTKYSEMRGIPLAIPPILEQLGIASFLDTETAKIDALVAEQEELIGLLKEKRQAVITHAVTKGLNPSAPVKSSGIEWLGDVPAHWSVVPVKHMAQMESGHTPDKKVAEYWDGGTIPWVSLNDTGFLRDNDYIGETAYQITQAGIENSSARLLPAGVVVFSRDATIGRCAITTKPMAVSQHFIAWICGEALLPEYLLQVFRSMGQELDRRATGATLKTIGMPDVRELVTPLPPIAEQKRIVERVLEDVQRLDTLLMEAGNAVGLLQERRSALISAAVTGQIDVRSLAA